MQSEHIRVDRRSAFTLVELAIAIAIIGALAGLAIPAYHSYRDRALVANAAADIHHMETTIDFAIVENRQVPDSIAHLFDNQTLDPWGNPYQYLNVSSTAPPGSKGKRRKDKNLVPINSDYDLYSMGKDGETSAPLTAKSSHDDIVRAGDGSFVGLAENF